MARMHRHQRTKGAKAHAKEHAKATFLLDVLTAKPSCYHPTTNLIVSGKGLASGAVSVTNLRAAATMKALQRADVREASKRNPNGTRHITALSHTAREARNCDDAKGYAIQLDRDHVLSTDGIVRKGKATRKQRHLG